MANHVWGCRFTCHSRIATLLDVTGDRRSAGAGPTVPGRSLAGLLETG